jgi:hypothetical protein
VPVFNERFLTSFDVRADVVGPTGRRASTVGLFLLGGEPFVHLQLGPHSGPVFRPRISLRLVDYPRSLSVLQLDLQKPIEKAPDAFVVDGEGHFDPIVEIATHPVR